jgi:hypothetical protein
MQNNMIKVRNFLLTSILILPLAACDVVQQTIVAPNPSGPAPLTNTEVISGLREALTVGINNATKLTSATDGFYKNPEIFIPLPEQARVVQDHANSLGLGAQVENVVVAMNRAAEEASKEAVPIFVEAIRGMSIGDGFAILNGGDGAATRFLMDRTTAQLKQTFMPKVKDAIDKVQLAQLWQPIVSRYNMTTTISGKPRVQEDLSEYVLDRSITGLFLMVEKEENKIRKDPVARVNDILRRVFGSVGN